MSAAVETHIDKALASLEDLSAKELDVGRHLEQAVSRADEELAAQIAHAPPPFWRHVRDALAERHP